MAADIYPYISENRRRNEMTGFYVAVSDRDLLGKVQELLRRQGYVGFTDTAGRINYLVDGRNNMYQACHTISQLSASYLHEAIPNGKDLPDRRRLRQLAQQLCEEAGLNMALKGSKILAYILVLAVEDETRLNPLSKFLYPRAAEYFGLKAAQVDRVIRYATKAAKIDCGNVRLISQMTNEILQKISNEAE